MESNHSRGVRLWWITSWSLITVRVFVFGGLHVATDSHGVQHQPIITLVHSVQLFCIVVGDVCLVYTVYNYI